MLIQSLSIPSAQKNTATDHCMLVSVVRFFFIWLRSSEHQDLQKNSGYGTNGGISKACCTLQYASACLFRIYGRAQTYGTHEVGHNLVLI